jgi:3',5'-cyclic-AMP phosphodiesterase
MQKKTLLYIFSIAAFLGLVSGGWFFANELRLKIAQGPDKDQFTAESQIGALSPALNSAKPKSPNPTVPVSPQTQAKTPQTETDAQEPAPTSDTNENNQDQKVDSFSFAVLGDTQRFDPDSADGGLQKAVKNIAGKNVDVVMTEGDLLSNCDGGAKCEKGLNDWKNTLGSLYSKTHEMMGNHDRTGGEKADALWQKFFDLPQNGPEGYKELVYSFDFENSHFVVLNSEKPEEHAVDKSQRDWLDQDLANNKKDNTFVFYHEPAYPVSSKIGESLDVNVKDRNALWKTLEDHKVTAVFNGHEHIQSRRKVDGIHQFVFGNTDSFDHDLPEAGVADYSYKGEHYGLVEVKGKEVTVNVYSVDGNLLDSYKLPS